MKVGDVGRGIGEWPSLKRGRRPVGTLLLLREVDVEEVLDRSLTSAVGIGPRQSRGYLCAEQRPRHALTPDDREALVKLRNGLTRFRAEITTPDDFAKNPVWVQMVGAEAARVVTDFLRVSR